MSKLTDSGEVLVQISKRSGTEGRHGSDGISRRNFLKVLGATSATALTACARDSAEKIIPYAQAENESIPGVAVWYNSTCTECAAGCGISVRTREGRAVKVEGNPLHPVNRGSLCGLGQASLQDLYDPDRVRQPMKRVNGAAGKPVFAPITWEEAFAEIAKALENESLERAFVSESLGNGALDELVDGWAKALKAEHVVYNALEPTAWASATEVVFGKRGLPQLDFEKPDVVLNFGADFLETWISPCEYAKSWANGRRKAQPTRHVHIEPRASLTAANADHFLTSAPGSEMAVALSILRAVVDAGKTNGLGSAQIAKIKDVTAMYTLDAASQQSGIAKNKLEKVVQWLLEAKSSLVIAGGILGQSENALSLSVIAQVLNVVLGNVGTSVDISKLRTAESSASKIEALSKRMAEKKVGVLFVHKANPVFTLPSEFNFAYAMRFVPLVVSFSSQLDETARNANLLLPAHTGLESWGDFNPLPGVYSLAQPSMTPVFDSQALGDLLLKVAGAAGKSVQVAGVDVAKGSNFEAVLKARWKRLQTRFGSSTASFEDFWKESVERGGVFLEEKTGAAGALPGLASAVDQIAQPLKAYSQKYSVGTSSGTELVLYPFTSVKGFDGRAANRPWLQELADPMSQVSWDAWVELHPKTAEKIGISKGDLVSVSNYYGEVNLPIYITPHVHPDVVAAPLGQGHSEYGRFAAETSHGGNLFDLIPAIKTGDGGSVALLSTKVQVKRARGALKLLQVQTQDDQSGREIARTSHLTPHGLVSKPKLTPHFHHVLGSEGAGHGDTHVQAEASGHGHEAEKQVGLVAVGHHAEGEHGHSTHPPKQMYEQREHPIYHWGMTIDLNACTGCSACVVACYAENNIPVVGKEAVGKGRRMSWIQISRYYDGGSEDLEVSFLPMTCQHCGHAPCEPVCPVYATYHNEEGLNAMVYNRCVGTRYCANNCSYKVRRFNWHEFSWPTPLDFQLNPDVTRRTAGVMEKCTFCVQRIVEAKDSAKDRGELLKDGDVTPACVQGCPTEALIFGNLNDPESKVSKSQRDDRAYKILDYHLNTQPAMSYQDRIRYEKI